MNDRRGMMLVVVALLFPLGLTWAYFVAMDGRAPGQQQAVYAIGKVIQFGLPLLGMWLLGRPPGRRGERGWMRSGVAFGVVVAVVMLACYHLWLRPVGVFDGPAVAVRAKLAGMGVRTVPVFVAVALGYSLVHSLLEEYYWRWFVFAELRRRVGMACAVWVSALGFTLHHIVVLGCYFGWGSIATWVFSLGVMIGGAFWAVVYARSGGLAVSWVSHAMVDAGIFVVAYDLVRSGLG